MRELEIHEVFTVLQKGDRIYSGMFDSSRYPYAPAEPVRCNYYSCMLFLKGKGFLVVDNFEYEVKPGRIFIFTDRQVIGWGYYENTIAQIVAFAPAVAMELNIRLDKPYVDIPEEERPLFTQICQNMVHQFQVRDALSEAIMQAGIGYLYALLSRYGDGPEMQDNTITAFRARVCNDFSANRSVEEIAADLHLPAKELNKKCLHKIGLTAKQFILELKITEAKRRLVFTALNAAEIAFQTGFEDPSYFTRIFRKKTALTPTEYRKKYQRST